MTTVRRLPAAGLALTATFALAAGAPLALAVPRAAPHIQLVGRKSERAGGDRRRRTPHPKPTGVPVRVVLTTANLSRALTTMPAIRFQRATNRGVPVLHVDDRVGYQTMVGFGAAMTDSSAWLLYDQLWPAVRQAAMSSLFSRAGIHLNFTLVPMGGSDFTVGGQPYSYDDLPVGQTDPQLTHFSIAHDQAYILPALRQMLHINPGIEVLATPWSPPPWMKANQAFDDLGGRGTVLPSYYQPLANYFVKFIQAYESRGVPIWGVTPENEPDAGSPFPASALAPQSEAAFIAQNLGPAFAAAGLHPRVYGNDTGAGDLAYAQTLLASPGAAQLSGLAWHCYGGVQTISTIHASNPTVQELMTECSPGIIPYGAAEAAISGARNWASTIVLWNLALDPTGGPVQPPDSGCVRCTGLLRISERTHRVNYSLAYYELGQLSKFVQRGAVRIGSDRWVSDFQTVSGYGVTQGLDNVAFLNPGGTRVLIAYNHSTHRSRFAASWHGRSFVYTLAAGATVTFTWK